jgi:hypothetical protein
MLLNHPWFIWEELIKGRGSIITIGSNDSLPICEMNISDRDEAREHAKVIAASVTGLRVAEATYLALLSIPQDSMWRIKNQSIYIALRDYISEATGKTSEEVQNSFEHLASEERRSSE